MMRIYIFVVFFVVFMNDCTILAQEICDDNIIFSNSPGNRRTPTRATDVDNSMEYRWYVNYNNSMCAGMKQVQRCNLMAWEATRNLQKFLNDYKVDPGDPNIKVSEELFYPGIEYNVNLTILNNGESVKSSKFVLSENQTSALIEPPTEKIMVRSNRAAPVLGKLNIQGPHKSFADVELYLNADVITCLGDIDDIKMKWQLFTDTGQLLSGLSYTGMQLLMPPRTFTAGMIYRVSAAATLNSTTIDTKSHILEIGKRGINVRLNVKKLTVGRNEPFKIVATIYNPDNVKGLDLDWSCIYENKDCDGFNGNTVVIDQRGGFSKPGRYKITAAIKAGGMAKRAACLIDVLDKGKIAIEVTEMPTLADCSKPIEIIVKVRKLVDGCKAQWKSRKEKGYDVINFEIMPGYSGIINVTYKEDMFLRELAEPGSGLIDRDFYLVIPPSQDSWVGLEGEKSYLIRLQLSCPQGPQPFFVDIPITTNASPRLEALRVDPVSGLALSTKFNFSVESAVDAIGDYPLLYKYGYVLNKRQLYFAFGSDLQTTVTILPYAEKGIQTILDCCDNKGSCTFIKGPVLDIQIPTQLSEDEESQLRKHFLKLLSQGDYTFAINYAIMLLETYDRFSNDLLKEDMENFVISSINTAISNMNDLVATSETYKYPANELLKSVVVLGDFIKLPEAVLMNIVRLRMSISDSGSRRARIVTDPENIEHLLDLINVYNNRNIKSFSVEDVSDYLETLELVIRQSDVAMTIENQKKNVVAVLNRYLGRLCSLLYEGQRIKIDLQTMYIVLEQLTDDYFTSFVDVPSASNKFNSSVKVKFLTKWKDYTIGGNLCVAKGILKNHLFRNGDVFLIDVYDANSYGKFQAGANLENYVVYEIPNQQTQTCMVFEDNNWNRCKRMKQNENSVLCECNKLGYYSADVIQPEEVPTNETATNQPPNEIPETTSVIANGITTIPDTNTESSHTESGYGNSPSLISDSPNNIDASSVVNPSATTPLNPASTENSNGRNNPEITDDNGSNTIGTTSPLNPTSNSNSDASASNNSQNHNPTEVSSSQSSSNSPNNGNNPTEVNNSQSSTNNPIEVNTSQSSNNNPNDVNNGQSSTNNPVQVNNSQSSTNNPTEVNNSQTITNNPNEVNTDQSSSSNPTVGDNGQSNNPNEVSHSESSSNNPIEVNTSQSSNDNPTEVNNEGQRSNNPTEVNNSQSTINSPNEANNTQSSTNNPNEINNSQSNSTNPSEVSNNPNSSNNPASTANSETNNNQNSLATTISINPTVNENALSNTESNTQNSLNNTANPGNPSENPSSSEGRSISDNLSSSGTTSSENSMIDNSTPRLITSENPLVNQGNPDNNNTPVLNPENSQNNTQNSIGITASNNPQDLENPLSLVTASNNPPDLANPTEIDTTIVLDSGTMETSTNSDIDPNGRTNPEIGDAASPIANPNSETPLNTTNFPPIENPDTDNSENNFGSTNVPNPDSMGTSVGLNGNSSNSLDTTISINPEPPVNTSPIASTDFNNIARNNTFEVTINNENISVNTLPIATTDFTIPRNNTLGTTINSSSVTNSLSNINNTDINAIGTSISMTPSVQNTTAVDNSEISPQNSMNPSAVTSEGINNPEQTVQATASSNIADANSVNPLTFLNSSPMITTDGNVNSDVPDNNTQRSVELTLSNNSEVAAGTTIPAITLGVNNPSPIESGSHSVITPNPATNSTGLDNMTISEGESNAISANPMLTTNSASSDNMNNSESENNPIISTTSSDSMANSEGGNNAISANPILSTSPQTIPSFPSENSTVISTSMPSSNTNVDADDNAATSTNNENQQPSNAGGATNSNDSPGANQMNTASTVNINTNIGNSQEVTGTNIPTNFTISVSVGTATSINPTGFRNASLLVNASTAAEVTAFTNVNAERTLNTTNYTTLADNEITTITPQNETMRNEQSSHVNNDSITQITQFTAGNDENAYSFTTPVINFNTATNGNDTLFGIPTTSNGNQILVTSSPAIGITSTSNGLTSTRNLEDNNANSITTLNSSTLINISSTSQGPMNITVGSINAVNSVVPRSNRSLFENPATFENATSSFNNRIDSDSQILESSSQSQSTTAAMEIVVETASNEVSFSTSKLPESSLDSTGLDNVQGTVFEDSTQSLHNSQITTSIVEETVLFERDSSSIIAQEQLNPTNAYPESTILDIRGIDTLGGPLNTEEVIMEPVENTASSYTNETSAITPSELSSSSSNQSTTYINNSQNDIGSTTESVNQSNGNTNQESLLIPTELNNNIATQFTNQFNNLSSIVSTTEINYQTNSFINQNDPLTEATTETINIVESSTELFSQSDNKSAFEVTSIINQFSGNGTNENRSLIPTESNEIPGSMQQTSNQSLGNVTSASTFHINSNNNQNFSLVTAGFINNILSTTESTNQTINESSKEVTSSINQFNSNGTNQNGSLIPTESNEIPGSMDQTSNQSTVEMNQQSTNNNSSLTPTESNNTINGSIAGTTTNQSTDEVPTETNNPSSNISLVSTEFNNSIGSTVTQSNPLNEDSTEANQQFNSSTNQNSSVFTTDFNGGNTESSVGLTTESIYSIPRTTDYNNLSDITTNQSFSVVTTESNNIGSQSTVETTQSTQTNSANNTNTQTIRSTSSADAFMNDEPAGDLSTLFSGSIEGQTSTSQINGDNNPSGGSTNLAVTQNSDSNGNPSNLGTTQNVVTFSSIYTTNREMGSSQTSSYSGSNTASTASPISPTARNENANNSPNGGRNNSTRSNQTENVPSTANNRTETPILSANILSASPITKSDEISLIIIGVSIIGIVLLGVIGAVMNRVKRERTVESSENSDYPRYANIFHQDTLEGAPR